MKKKHCGLLVILLEISINPCMLAIQNDRGGNDHLLEFNDGRKTNMHSVWDGQIIEHMDSLFGEQYLTKKVSKKIGKFINNPHSHEFESCGSRKPRYCEEISWLSK